MHTVAQAVELMERLSPTALAEEWDNVGLLIGDREGSLERLMTCLTVTPDVVEEALDRDAQLVVAHHPLPFRPLSKITTETTEGRMLLRLIGAGVSLYSAHTAYDSAELGVNQQLAEGLGLTGAKPFVPDEDDPLIGVGRIGDAGAGATLTDLVEKAKALLGIDSVRIVGEPGATAQRVAVACGSGGSLFDAAMRAGCQAILTGEATFHDCLKARSHGVGLVLVGHYASERFAMEALADRLGEELPGVETWASTHESDPLQSA